MGHTDRILVIKGRGRRIKIQVYLPLHSDPDWALPPCRSVLMKEAAHHCVASQPAFLGSRLKDALNSFLDFKFAEFHHL